MITVERLIAESHLPGPRANLSLLAAFVAEADEARVRACLGVLTPGVANSPEEFVGMCGVVAGAVLRRHTDAYAFLRPFAGHGSWRIREAVAMALQELSTDLSSSLEKLDDWAVGSPLERRAVVAGLCEPKLLGDPVATRGLVELLSTLTREFDHDRRLSPDEQVLRQALGYGWSVALAAYPTGLGVFGELFSLRGKHLVWILAENLKKNRLVRLDPDWVRERQRSLKG